MFDSRSANEYFEKNEKQTYKKQTRRIRMILDLLYFTRMAERRTATIVFKEQDTYMMKTARRSILETERKYRKFPNKV